MIVTATLCPEETAEEQGDEETWRDRSHVRNIYRYVRIGIIGDVHAEDIALAEALDRFRAEKVDSILCVGDVADGAGDLERCVALLEDNGVLTVRGNHDRWLVTNRVRDLPNVHFLDRLSNRAVDFFQSLPPTRTIDTPAGKLLLCHGVGADDMQRLGPDDEGYALTSNLELQTLLTQDFAIAVGGHTHQRMDRTFGSLRFINAGTLLHSHDPCFGMVSIGASIDVVFYEGQSSSLAGR